MIKAKATLALATLVLGACTHDGQANSEQRPRCEPSSSSRPSQDLGAMLGSGPARPVFNSQTGQIEYAEPNGEAVFKGEWGGNKILWAVAPGAGEVTVRGHEVGGEGQVRFGPGEHPDATLVLAVSSGATSWSDFPGFTRVKGPGCYAFEVSSRSGTEQIVFSFV